jgi:MYXO-CTERM domain-containing protein
MRGHVIALAALLLVSGPAAAQSVELAIENAPEDQQITAGNTAALSMDLNVSVSGTTCVEAIALPGNATADLTVQGSAPEGASNSASGQEIAFEVPQGDHGNAEDPYQEVQSAAISVQTSGGVSEDYTLEVGLTGATSAVTADMSCFPGEFPASEDTASVTVDVAADQAATDGRANDGGSMDGGADGGSTDGGSMDDGGAPDDSDDATDGGPEDDGSDTPAPGAVAALVAALGAALARRRG